MGLAAVKKKSLKLCEIRELIRTLDCKRGGPCGFRTPGFSELRDSPSSFISQAQKLQSNNKRVIQMLFSSLSPQADSQTSSAPWAQVHGQVQVAEASPSIGTLPLSKSPKDSQFKAILLGTCFKRLSYKNKNQILHTRSKKTCLQRHDPENHP